MKNLPFRLAVCVMSLGLVSAARAGGDVAAPIVDPTPSGGGQSVSPTLNVITPGAGLTVPNNVNVAPIGGANISAGNANVQAQTGAGTARTANGTASAGTRRAATTQSATFSPNAAATTNPAAANGLPAANTAERSAAPSGVTAAASAGAENKALNSAAKDIQQSQAADAKVPGGMDAANAVRRLFDRERTAAGVTAGPSEAENAAGPAPASGAGSGAVRGKTEAAQEAIVQKLEIAATLTHTAPKEYRDALTTARESEKTGLISASTAKELTGIIYGAAKQTAQSALSKIVRAAYAAAASGRDKKGDDYERALGAPRTISSPGEKGSLDDWNDLLSTPGKPLIKNLDDLRRDLVRVHTLAQPGHTERVEAPNVSIKAVGGQLFADLPRGGIEKIEAPSFFLRDNAVPRFAPRPRQPYEAGFSALEGYRRLREQGVAFWPAAEFVARDAGRSLWQAVMGRPAAPALSDEQTAALLAQVEADSAARDLKAVAADYAALTGDRDAVPAAEKALRLNSPRAKNYWLSRLTDLAERRRPAPTPARAAEKPEAAALGSFGDYVAAHRAAAAAAAEDLERRDPTFAKFSPAGTVRRGDLDLRVERWGKTLLGTDSATHERFALLAH